MPFFKGRLEFLNLFEFKTKFDAKEWTTGASFAFGVNYVPGRSDETVMEEKVYKYVLGRLDHPREHALRRLFYESHALAQADLDRLAANPDQEGKAPRKIPIEERGQRWDDLVLELSSLTLRGELEPSFQLVDKYVEQYELNELKYIRWEEYTKRSQEQKGVKKISLWGEQDGHLVRQHVDEQLVNHAEDRLDLYRALQRRGLALQLGHIISFIAHEKLINFYFEEMSREPVDPKRYEKLTINQVHNADREVWTIMGEATR